MEPKLNRKYKEENKLKICQATFTSNERDDEASLYLKALCQFVRDHKAKKCHYSEARLQIDEEIFNGLVQTRIFISPRNCSSLEIFRRNE